MHITELEHSAHDARPTTRGEPAEKRLKVLMLAFACGPGRGSEPGQGWNFARGMAAYHDVCVLVYSGFRKVIEEELAQRPVAGLQVVYYYLPFEHPRHWRDGVDRHGLSEQLHYYFWNLRAAKVARALHAEAGFDLVHHVSFIRYWSPSAVATVDAPFLWGPVGGGESAPKVFYPSFGWKGHLFERARDLARALAHLDPFVRRTAQRATLTLATTEQSAERIRKLGGVRMDVRGAVALNNEEIERLAELPALRSGAIRFVSVGRLLHWKGYELGLRAFARALSEDRYSSNAVLAGAEYWIIGDGPERARLEAAAQKLEIANCVKFLGLLPRSEVLTRLAKTHVIVHPSFHDSGGFATLEGMAAGRPVICLALGGPGLQVTSDCGIVIPVESPKQVIDDLSAAMLLLATDPERREKMGSAARRRVAQQFSWDALITDVREQYIKLATRARFVTAADASHTE
ncbi:MAG: glycosyltransferase family 4 protein [Bacteroidetes bacterium]|nr:glycosyltransferase family 4 protein [Bacteroidota bacterium]